MIIHIDPLVLRASIKADPLRQWTEVKYLYAPGVDIMFARNWREIFMSVSDLIRGSKDPLLDEIDAEMIAYAKDKLREWNDEMMGDE